MIWWCKLHAVIRYMTVHGDAAVIHLSLYTVIFMHLYIVWQQQQQQRRPVPYNRCKNDARQCLLALTRCSADDATYLVHRHYLRHQPSSTARLWLYQHNLRPATHNVSQEACRRFSKLVSSVSPARCRHHSWRRQGVEAGNSSRLN